MNKKRYQLLMNTHDVTREWLTENEFYWNPKYKRFIHRWNVLKIADFTYIYAELRLDLHTMLCEMDVMDGPHTYYGPYLQYLRGFADPQDARVARVCEHIKSEFDRLHIVEVGE